MKALVRGLIGNRTEGLIFLTATGKPWTFANMQERWRKLNGSHLLPLVRAGIPFVDGVQIERREDQENRKEAA